jgi:hypothetical protein
MPAAKLSEAVSDTECQARLESQDKINKDLNRTLHDILKAINGTPGDTRNPGLAGGFLRMCDKVESCNEKIDALNDKLIILESKDLVGQMRSMNERVDTLAEDQKADREEAKRMQWSKILITSLSTAAASLTLAAAAYGIMGKLDSKPKVQPPVTHANPAKTTTPRRTDW